MILRINQPTMDIEADLEPAPAPEPERRPAGDALAKAAAAVLALDWPDTPRGVVRLALTKTLCFFGHDGDPDTTDRVKQCVQTIRDALSDLKIGVIGFGAEGSTWCMVIDCHADLDDAFDKLASAAWWASDGNSSRQVKKATKWLRRRLSACNGAPSGTQSKTDPRIASPSAKIAPGAGAASEQLRLGLPRLWRRRSRKARGSRRRQGFRDVPNRGP